MRLFTNSNNINSLKVLVAGELAGQTIQVTGVAPNGELVSVSIYPWELSPIYFLANCGVAQLFEQCAGFLLGKFIYIYIYILSFVYII